MTMTADERVADVGMARRLLIRPELGAVVGLVVVFVFFSAQSPVFRSAVASPTGSTRPPRSASWRSRWRC